MKTLTKTLSELKKQFPNCWQQADDMIMDKGNGLPDWPRWCYLPMAGWQAIASQASTNPMENAANTAKLAALGAWRITQGIYEFEPSFYKALTKTPFLQEMPAAVLYRLPQHCLYIKGHDLDFGGAAIDGFFVHLEYDINTQLHELRLLLQTETGFVPLILHLKNWTVSEAIEDALKQSEKNAGFSFPAELSEQLTKTATQIMPLLLYICSENPDYQGKKPEMAKAKKTKKGWRMFPTQKPTTFILGQPLDLFEKKDGAQKKPHIRAAHWHGYWKGSGTDKKFFYNWLAPMIINKNA